MCLGSKDAYGTRVILDFCKKFLSTKVSSIHEVISIEVMIILCIGIDNPQVVGEGYILATMHEQE